MLLSVTLRKDGQAAESRLALWLCLAGEVGSALEQESTMAFVHCSSSQSCHHHYLCLLCGLGQLCPGTIFFPPTLSSRRRFISYFSTGSHSLGPLVQPSRLSQAVFPPFPFLPPLSYKTLVFENSFFPRSNPEGLCREKSL